MSFCDICGLYRKIRMLKYCFYYFMRLIFSYKGSCLVWRLSVKFWNVKIQYSTVSLLKKRCLSRFLLLGFHHVHTFLYLTSKYTWCNQLYCHNFNWKFLFGRTNDKGYCVLLINKRFLKISLFDILINPLPIHFGTKNEQ